MHVDQKYILGFGVQRRLIVEEAMISKGAVDSASRRVIILAAIGGAAAAVFGIFRGRIPGTLRREDFPADLPGKGSIFQPRNDPR